MTFGKTKIARVATIVITALLVCAALPITSHDGRANATTSSGFTYAIENGDYGYGAYVTGCTGKNPVVPATLGGQPVVSVTLVFANKGILSLDVSACTNLKFLNCSDNKLKTLNVGNNPALEEFHCYSNELSTLDVSKNTALKSFSCGSNNLKVLDVSKNTSLKSLCCGSNNLKVLDVSKNTSLKSFSCDSNNLKVLDVSNNTKLEYLYCGKNRLKKLNVRKNKALTSLGCSDNKLTKLNIRKNIALIDLYCFNNKLTTLDIKKNKKLSEFDCRYNKISDKALQRYLVKRFDKESVLPQNRHPFSSAQIVAVSEKQFTGKQVKPTLKIGYGNKKLRQGKDYTVSYGANKSIGKGKVTVKGTGIYSGKKTVKFNIVPTTLSISKLTFDEGQIKVEWKASPKAERITAYQIRYTLKGSSNWSEPITVSARKSSAVINGLEKGKAYSFQLRSYKTVSGKNYYAAWIEGVTANLGRQKAKN